MDFTHSTGEWIEWKVSSETARSEKITFIYACIPDCPLELKVNGMVLESMLSFPATSSWTDWQRLEINVQLIEGDNTVRITTIGYNGGIFDALIVGGMSSQYGNEGEYIYFGD